MTDTKACNFASALTALCREHGLMLWTAYAAAPMMLSPVNPDTMFHYTVETPYLGNASIVRRVLD